LARSTVLVTFGMVDIHVVTAWRRRRSHCATTRNVDSDVSAGSGTFMPAASPVRRYPTTVSGSRSPGTTAGMPGGYGVICSAATRPTASQRAPAPPLRRTRRGAASPSLAVSPSGSTIGRGRSKFGRGAPRPHRGDEPRRGVLAVGTHNTGRPPVTATRAPEM
jgi:hypothetical protein